MKKNALTILLLLLSVIVVYSQSVIDNPKTGLSVNNNSKITKVVLTDSTTTLHFHTYHTPGQWISIPRETYIQPVGSEKLFIKSAQGIALNDRYTMPPSGEVSYKLIFPAIPKTTCYIDYGEANAGGSWFIYDIQTKPMDSKSGLQKELSGNWFDKSTGNWELGFFDKYIVYQKQVWSYNFTKPKKGLKSVKLTGNGKSVELFYRTATAGSLLIGESGQSLKEYSNNATEARKKKAIDDKPFELPVFKIDSAIYSGCILNYTSRVGMKTLSISIDDIITGNQTSHVIKIDENGYFSAKLPMYYPHLCWVRSSIYNGSVFLEPGKDLFQLIGDSNRMLCMGESARLNSELPELNKLRSFDYGDMQSKILDMSPIQYKAYCNRFETKDINALDSIMKTNTISTKAYQIMKMEFEYEYAASKMFYDYYWESAYREKNKIPRTERTLPVKSDSLTAQYFDFVNTEIANNPLAVICSGYNSFINRLKYLDILRIGGSFSINTQSMGAELEKSGYTFTESEKLMLEKLKEVDSISNSAEEKTYNEKYSKQIREFYTKYQENFESIRKNTPKADKTVVDKYFKDNKIKLTADEKKLWKIITKHDNSVNTKKIQEFYVTYGGDSVNAFHVKHNSFINEFFAQKSNESRNRNMKTLLGIEPGFARDLMLAQDNCRNILEELSPVSPKKLQSLQQQFVTPFIAEYIGVCNNQAIAKLDANKKKTGFMVNEVPKTDADKVFDAIIQKYKGKVVYVDFWATWCGPCRSGIEIIKPLKEDMDGQDVVFVYITNPTSPQTTWSNMIPDIKGEHYRVSDDEWNYLKEKFNISGIPHYVLVGKNGEVINPDLGHFDNDRLKSELTKHINN